MIQVRKQWSETYLSRGTRCSICPCLPQNIAAADACRLACTTTQGSCGRRFNRKIPSPFAVLQAAVK
jgi:hypothetical protein